MCNYAFFPGKIFKYNVDRGPNGFASGHLELWQLSIQVKLSQILETAFPQLSRMGSLMYLLKIFHALLCIFQVDRFYDASFKQLFADLVNKIQASI